LVGTSITAARYAAMEYTPAAFTALSEPTKNTSALAATNSAKPPNAPNAMNCPISLRKLLSKNAHSGFQCHSPMLFR
jgi:hypothetical protein